MQASLNPCHARGRRCRWLGNFTGREGWCRLIPFLSGDLCGSDSNRGEFATILRRRWPGLRRGIALVALVNYLALAVGLPLPACSYAAMGPDAGVRRRILAAIIAAAAVGRAMLERSAAASALPRSWPGLAATGITPPAFVVAEPEAASGQHAIAGPKELLLRLSPWSRKSCCSPVQPSRRRKQLRRQNDLAGSRICRPHDAAGAAAVASGSTCRSACRSRPSTAPNLLRQQVEVFLSVCRIDPDFGVFSTADPPPRIV